MMKDQPEPTIAALSSRRGAEADHALAARYAPILKFDRREPFLPLAAGYTVFRASGPSPSFPRQIQLAEVGQPLAVLAIEYAIWWDWDIQHLYELEHAWVYLDAAGRVVRAEASWHGGYHDMAAGGVIPLSGDRLTLFSEPGKHAFAPVSDWLGQRAAKTQTACTRLAGVDGLLVTRLFKGLIQSKTPQADRLAQTYLERCAFEPSFDFDQIYPFPAEALVPWPALFEWIPQRLAWWVTELERTIPPAERRCWRIAHRGASAHAPENTLAAIVKAAELGADMVELDVQHSADGVPIIIHDANLSRTTNGSGFVSEQTLAELKTLDAGQGETIPTLEEAVRCCLEHDLRVYLELKSGRVVRKAAELIGQHQLYDQIIVTSFRPDWLADIKALDPEIVTSILFGSPQLDPVALAHSIGAEYVHPAWENRSDAPHRLFTSEWLKRVRGAGLGVICWHEERPAEIAALRQLGLDGICSNAPELLI
jgi:glycerophosphoryl diester phosphodiesterase